MFQKEFQNLGLTKGESKVYSYLLKEKQSTTGPIVKNSGVAYSKVYEILERLIRKGLVSFITKEKTKYYKALQASRLKEYLGKEKKEIQDKERLLNELLPKLNKLNKDEKSSAEVYTGINGIKTAYENLIEDKREKTIQYFYSYKKETYKKLNDFYYSLFPKLKKWKISLKGIANQEFKKQFKKEKNPYANIKFVKFPIPSNIDIFSDKILISIWQDSPMAILITSKEVSDSFKEYFNDVWKTAKE